MDDCAAPFVKHARRCSELGWVLLDLDGKEPRRKQWQKSRYAGPEEVAGRFKVWGARLNMGVLLGPSSLEVVEPDTPAAYATLLELCGGELPVTPTVRSGGKSLHLYFRANGAAAASRDGLELRAGNQQCVLPPSVHPETGRPYVWLPGLAPWEVEL